MICMMLSVLRKYEVWVFLGLIVVVNGLFVSGIGFDILPRGLYSYGRFALLAGLLCGIVILARGWAGIADLLRPMLEWRRPVRWYLFALLWNPAICLTILAAIYVVNRNAMPDFSPNFAIAVRPSVMKTVLISSFIGEIVWISYAIRRLSGQFTPYMSAMIVGVVWTCWWVPMVFYNIGIIPNLPLGGLLINQVGVAAMCTFVYMHTKSGFLVLCLQVVFNTTILVLPLTPNMGGVTTYWTFAMAYFIAALLLFVVFGPKPLFVDPANQGRSVRI
jgi:hypothetical protein